MTDKHKGETKKSVRKIKWNENEIQSFKLIKETMKSGIYRTQPNLVKRA